MSGWLRRLVDIALLLSLVAVGGVIGFSARKHPIEDSKFNRSTAVESSTETVLVYLVSGDCGASESEPLKLAMRVERDRLLVDATQRGVHVRSIGVALNNSFDSGSRLLSEFGRFDQLILGSGWLNEGVVRFAWRDLPGPASLPQLIVLRRRIEMKDSHIEVSADTLVRRLTGIDQIREWLEDPRTRL